MTPSLAATLPSLASAPLIYAVARVVEARLATPVDPATVFWTTPIALFHRYALVGYLGVLLALATHLVARRAPHFPLRAAERLLPVSVVALALQVIFFP